MDLQTNFMLNVIYRNDPPRTKGEESDPDERKGNDSLMNSSPTDSRSDEKVVVNEQRSNKIVNGPSPSTINTGDESSYDDDEILD